MPAVDVAAQKNELKEALVACPFARLRNIYEEWSTVIRMTTTEPVADTTDRNNREAMEKQVRGTSVVGPLNVAYRSAFLQNLRALGGMKITFVTGKKGFAYTCGFASVGSKELLVVDVHHSMGSSISPVLDYLYEQHKEGHHQLGNGHTVVGGNVAYLVAEPDPLEETLLKTTKTLEPTRLYGIARYGLLLLSPVVVKSDDADDGDDKDDPGGLTREEMMTIGVFGAEIKGFKRLGGAPKKLEGCSCCRKVRDATRQTPLFKCNGCKYAYYCSKECQRLDWGNHKQTCRANSKEERLLRQMAAQPFGKEAYVLMKTHQAGAER